MLIYIYIYLCSESQGYNDETKKVKLEIVVILNNDSFFQKQARGGT